MHCAWCWLVAEMGVGFRAGEQCKDSTIENRCALEEDSDHLEIFITTTTRSSIHLCQLAL